MDRLPEDPVCRFGSVLRHAIWSRVNLTAIIITRQKAVDTGASPSQQLRLPPPPPLQPSLSLSRAFFLFNFLQDLSLARYTCMYIYTVLSVCIGCSFARSSTAFHGSTSWHTRIAFSSLFIFIALCFSLLGFFLSSSCLIARSP